MYNKEKLKEVKEMKTYKATFIDGRTANYTIAVLELLKIDNDVIEIMDNETGEILKTEKEF